MSHHLYLTSDRAGLLAANGRAVGPLDESPRRFSFEGEAYLQFFPFGQAVMPSCVRFYEGKLGPALEGGLLRLWPGGELELRFENAGVIKKDNLPELLAKSFLQNVALNRRSSALLALSRSLLATIDFEQLREFLGPLSGFEPARFVPEGEGGVTLGVYREEGGSLRRLRLISFDFLEQLGDLKIDNIRIYA